MNKVILIGNAGKDSELIALTSGNTVTKFSMATTENYKDKNGDWQKKTEWHNIQIWNTKQEVKKGDLVCVEGKLTTQKKNEIYYKRDSQKAQYAVYVWKTKQHGI